MDRVGSAIHRPDRRRVRFSPPSLPLEPSRSHATLRSAIAFIHNLVTSHAFPISRAYPHGIAQFRTLRSEHETASRAAQLQAASFGAVFFGELDKTLAVEERVLDEWVGAREIQNSFAAGTGGAASSAAVPVGGAAVLAESGQWAPAEMRPAHGIGAEDESLFSGGVEYLQAVRRRSPLPPFSVSQREQSTD